jgi:hypothetical protein
MRRISSQIEALEATQFIFLIGVVAGTIQGIPQLLLGGRTGAGLKAIPFLVIGCVAMLWWTGAFLLWWIAVHRRQSALWMIATQVTLGLVIADLVHAAITAIPAGIETHGQFTAVLLREPWTFVLSNLQFSLIRSPLWFLGSLGAIAMGRQLNTRESLHPAAPASATHLDAVT